MILSDRLMSANGLKALCGLRHRREDTWNQMVANAAPHFRFPG